MEFKSVIGWLNSFVMETWINYLKFSNKVRTVAGLSWFRDVNNDTPT